MSSHYDTYNYPLFWKSRKYEHEAEILALKEFLQNIPTPKKIIEIGVGFGRLIPIYGKGSSEITVTDPSSVLLNMARQKFKKQKIKFIQSKLENFDRRIRNNFFDLAIMVRVLHHIKDVGYAFSIVNRKLKTNGYFILEFANKSHMKANVSEILKGNYTTPFEIFPKDIRSARSIENKTLPFTNYHPDKIKEILASSGFKIVKIKSVSNMRIPLIKERVPLNILLFIEKHIQNILSRLYFGPSIFILAKKVR